MRLEGYDGGDLGAGVTAYQYGDDDFFVCRGVGIPGLPGTYAQQNARAAVQRYGLSVHRVARNGIGRSEFATQSPVAFLRESFGESNWQRGFAANAGIDTDYFNVRLLYLSQSDEYRSWYRRLNALQSFSFTTFRDLDGVTLDGGFGMFDVIRDLITAGYPVRFLTQPLFVPAWIPRPSFSVRR